MSDYSPLGHPGFPSGFVRHKRENTGFCMHYVHACNVSVVCPRIKSLILICMEIRLLVCFRAPYRDSIRAI